MGNPDLILLDEPSEGLAPLVVRDLGEQIQRLKESGITILLCEQNAKFAINLSDRAYVLEKGQVRFSGTIEDLQGNDDIRQQYHALQRIWPLMIRPPARRGRDIPEAPPRVRAPCGAR
jgi:branched-chain amino acid transport system ATP-binding protein